MVSARKVKITISPARALIGWAERKTQVVALREVWFVPTSLPLSDARPHPNRHGQSPVPFPLKSIESCCSAVFIMTFHLTESAKNSRCQQV